MIHPSLRHTEHRPWQVPREPWMVAQTWSNLLFAHWRVPVDELRRQIPEPLEIDTFAGEAWIGVVPFYLTIRPRFLPVIPKLASFPEINVRTYVTYKDRPGVWFFSLDATSPLAVRAARWGFSLPYFDAQMTCKVEAERVAYSSYRQGSTLAAEFHASYAPTSDPWLAEPGSLEAWLTERYCLYAMNLKKKSSPSISTTEVHHEPWPLQDASCTIEKNSMTAPIGIDLDGEPLLHFAKHIAVVNWRPQSVDTSSPPSPAE